MLVHQSDISAWIRCPQAFMYGKQGQPRVQLSASAYGSVMHHALEAFERLRHIEGITFDDALSAAISTFDHYWHPLNIETITEPVQEWMPRQSYASLRLKGIESLKQYAELVRNDDVTLLATEYGFSVPIEGTWDDELGEPHVLAGTIDKLGLRKTRGRPYVSVEDYKTGREYTYLRQNVQFSAYCYATTRPEFWTGWRGEDGFGEETGYQLYQRTKTFARHGMWINLKKVKNQDAGWRGPMDYRRFAIAVEQIVASIKADIYPLSISGEACTFCEFREICAGTGVPTNEHGAPA